MPKTTTKPPRIARATITGVSPYAPGRAFPPDLKKNSDETHDEFDKRCWRHRAHAVDGYAVIPGAAIHKALIAAAKFRGEKIPGAGAKTWTKRFGAGCLVLRHFTILPKVKTERMEGETVHVPSDGRPGGTSRVYRTFPIFREWSAEVEVVVVDGLIDDDTFRRHLETAGKFVGIGTHRPSSNSPGPYGRFSVGELSWEDAE